MSRSSCRRRCVVTRRRSYKNGSIFDVRFFDVYNDGFDVVSRNVYRITLSRINFLMMIDNWYFMMVVFNGLDRGGRCLIVVPVLNR
jgi:hypothetical protein